MGFKVGIPVMKCSLHPSQQTNSRTGKAAKTCGVEAAWREMNDERIGRDMTINRDLTPNNVWMVGSTDDDLPGIVQARIDRINEERKENGKRALRRDAVSVIQVVEKPPVEYMQTLTPDEQKDFLRDSHAVMTGLIHEWNERWEIISAVQHHDEWGGRSPHTHTMILTSSADENGVPTMNAKKEVNLKFFNHINKSYPERMRALGYDVENCRTYDQLSEEEKRERRLNPPEHGKDSYEYKQDRKERLSQEINELETQKESMKKELSDSKGQLISAQEELFGTMEEAIIASGDLAEAQNELQETRREIGDLRSEKEELARQTEKAVTAKETYEQHAALAIKKEQLYNDKLLQLTDAPSVASYESVLQENNRLREELSLKDRLIERLTEERNRFREAAEQWKETAAEWRGRFSDVAHRAGSRMMGFLGYDVSEDETIREYPDRKASSGIAEITKSLEEQDPRQYQVLPDNNNDGKFRVASRNNDGDLVTIRGGFEDRRSAENWRKNVSDASREITRVLDDGISKGISRSR